MSNVIHRAAGCQSLIPKMEPHVESSGCHKMIAEESVAGLCNLLFNVHMLSSFMTLFHNKDGTRLTVKSIVVDIGTVVTVRDLCLHEKHE